MKIINIVGARPNFMKIAPLMYEYRKYDDIEPLLVHTGQHYDERMSDLFFRQLGIPEPDINLEVGSASHAVQTAAIMTAFEPVVLEHKPDVVLVVGDVNSTIACGLVAVKLGLKLVHVEAGLRSGDRGMPEEINRVLTDSISDMLFCTEQSGVNNLTREGVAEDKIHLVGHVMIDTLLNNLEKAKNSTILEELHRQGCLSRTAGRSDGLTVGQCKDRRVGRAECKKGRIEDGQTVGQLDGGTVGRWDGQAVGQLDGKDSTVTDSYAVLTMHRPSNVDDAVVFSRILDALEVIQRDMPILFPIHPRTRKNMGKLGLQERIDGLANLHLLEPIGYLDFLKLQSSATIVLTDSGGIQEETTVLKIPCITLRENTERPITAEIGSNQIVGTDTEKIIAAYRNAISGDWREPAVPPFWDGHAAERIVRIMKDCF